MSSSPSTESAERTPNSRRLVASPALQRTRRFPIEVCFRRCEERDLPELEWFGMFTPHRAIVRATFERQRAGEAEMLIGETGGFPVAQAWLDLNQGATEGVGVLWAVRVFPFLRGLGIGTELMAYAEDRLRSLGFTACELGVDKDNVRAIQLYARRGYETVREALEESSYPCEDGGHIHQVHDLWILRKALG